jgi:hypothetical protein
MHVGIVGANKKLVGFHNIIATRTNETLRGRIEKRDTEKTERKECRAWGAGRGEGRTCGGAIFENHRKIRKVERASAARCSPPGPIKCRSKSLGFMVLHVCQPLADEFLTQAHTASE